MKPIDPTTIRAYGTWVLVRFDPKPTKSAGGLHLPLSQQVEPEWATIVAVGHDVKEKIPVGARAIVSAHMNGDKLEGTDCHWMQEKYILGVVE